MKKYTCNKYVEAYFTVEATCIYPFAIAVILLVIYFWFFRYDRCLMEQDAAGIMVKGAIQQNISANDRVAYMNQLFSNNYKDQYLCWTEGEKEISYDGGTLGISVQGSLYFPFEGLNFWGNDNNWEAGRSYKCKEYDRIFIIRTYRKIQGLI